MPCFHPVHGWYTAKKTALGKRAFTTNKKESLSDRPLTIPCGRCSGCRLEKSRQWAVRCTHESSLHDCNSFITLTYDSANIPPYGSLVLSDFQKFLKRLRKALGKNGKKIRFFHCGEYGDREGRPHYHAIIFGYDFPDRTHWRTTDRGDKLYRSKLLESLWTAGASEIGSVTFESAAYVARYNMKKVNGPMADTHYSRVDLATGEIVKIQPEYCTMSRRPGIGDGWFKKFHTDAYPSDTLTLNGKKMRPPRFYDNRFEILDADRMDKIKAKRSREGKKTVDNNTPERLAVREEVLETKLKKLKRTV